MSDRWLFHFSFLCRPGEGVDVELHVYPMTAPHIRDLIEHPQYEPDGRFPW